MAGTFSPLNIIRKRFRAPGKVTGSELGESCQNHPKPTYTHRAERLTDKQLATSAKRFAASILPQDFKFQPCGPPHPSRYIHLPASATGCPRVS